MVLLIFVSGVDTIVALVLNSVCVVVLLNLNVFWDKHEWFFTLILIIVPYNSGLE